MNPWDKLPDETSKAHAAFCIYRDLGPARSLSKACEAVYGGTAVNLRYVETWSARFDWVKRASAWDENEEAMKAELRARVREKARQKFADRSMDLALKLIDTALEGGADSAQVRALIEALNRAGVTAPVKVEHEHKHRVELRDHLEDVEELSPEDALKLYRESLH